VAEPLRPPKSVIDLEHPGVIDNYKPKVVYGEWVVSERILSFCRLEHISSVVGVVAHHTLFSSTSEDVSVVVRSFGL
jgi:hypothetical protein